MNFALLLLEAALPAFCLAILAWMVHSAFSAVRAKKALVEILRKQDKDEIAQLLTLIRPFDGADSNNDGLDQSLRLRRKLDSLARQLSPRDREPVLQALHQPSARGQSAYAAHVLEDALAD